MRHGCSTSSTVATAQMTRLTLPSWEPWMLLCLPRCMKTALASPPTRHDFASLPSLTRPWLPTFHHTPFLDFVFAFICQATSSDLRPTARQCMCDCHWYVRDCLCLACGPQFHISRKLRRPRPCWKKLDPYAQTLKEMKTEIKELKRIIVFLNK